MWQSGGPEERDLKMTKKEIQKAVLILFDTVEVFFWHLDLHKMNEGFRPMISILEFFAQKVSMKTIYATLYS